MARRPSQRVQAHPPARVGAHRRVPGARRPAAQVALLPALPAARARAPAAARLRALRRLLQPRCPLPPDDRASHQLSWYVTSKCTIESTFCRRM